MASCSGQIDRYESDQCTVVSLVLPYLERYDWLRLRLVSSSWNYAIVQELRATKSLTVQDFMPVSARGKVAANGSSCQPRKDHSLGVFIEAILKSGLLHFDNDFRAPYLLTLDDVRNLAHSPFCASLRSIDLTGCDARFNALCRVVFNELLIKLPNLEALILRKTFAGPSASSAFTHQLFDSISSLVNLKYFDITGAKWFSGELFQVMPTSVETMILDGCNLCHVAASKHTGRLENLRCLSFDGSSPDFEFAVAGLMRLKRLIVNGSNVSCPTAWASPLHRLCNTSPELKQVGGALSTLCLGKDVRNINVAEMKAYLGHPLVQTSLEILEMHSINFVVNDNQQLSVLHSCMETVGNLHQLQHLELSLWKSLRAGAPTVLLSIIHGCPKLRSLAWKCHFVWPVDEQNLNSLRQINLLESLIELCWISADEGRCLRAPLSLCLDVICSELGNRLKRLRFGVLKTWPASFFSPRMQLLPVLTHLEVIFDGQRPAQPTGQHIRLLLTLLKKSLNSLCLLNCKDATSRFMDFLPDLKERFPKVKITVKDACVDEFEPVLAGGSVEGLRMNLKTATSYARIVDGAFPGL